MQMHSAANRPEPWIRSTPLWLWWIVALLSVVLVWLVATGRSTRFPRAVSSHSGVPLRSPDALEAGAIEHKLVPATASRTPKMAVVVEDPLMAAIRAPAEQADYSQRAAALETLFTRRSSADWQMLHALMTDPILLQELTPTDRLGLLQLVAAFLVREDPDRQRLTDSMLQGFEDPGHYPTSTRAWLQHADLFYARDGDHATLSSRLWDLVEQPDSTFADEALAALTRAAFNEANIDHERLAEAVRRTLDTNSSRPGLLIVALKTGTWLHYPLVVARARQFVADAGSDINVRLTALAVLAEEGSDRDIAVLEHLVRTASLPISSGARGAALHLRRTLAGRL